MLAQEEIKAAARLTGFPFLSIYGAELIGQRNQPQPFPALAVSCRSPNSNLSAVTEGYFEK